MPAIPAEDVVSVRRARLRGIGEAALRRNLATIVTPRTRRWIFIPRLTVRAPARAIGASLQQAITRLLAEAGPEVVAYPDFAALAVACARQSGTGGLRSWYWQALGVSPFSPPGEAVATLLAANPMEAGTAVAALARHDLLAPVWRTMPDAAAARFVAALAVATQSAIPPWPPDERPDTAPAVASGAAEFLARAEAFWRPALAGLPPRAEAFRAACLLALLRWSPAALTSGDTRPFAALVARLGGDRTAAGAATMPAFAEPAAPVEAETPRARAIVSRSPDSLLDGAADPPAREDEPSPAAEPEAEYAEEIATDWGGVLFLVNALTRLGIQDRLAAACADGPTGWRVMLDLALALGLPPEEPMTMFIEQQDAATTTPPEWIAALLSGLTELYEADGPWPLPLLQRGRLRATETHLDLHLATTAIDLELRLAGLDFDPGWVPWLGRVIAFHYDNVTVHLAGGR